MQSENMKFFSDASYEVQSADFKIKTAHLAKIVSVLFQYLKPEIEDYIKEKEEEVSVEVNSSSECLGVPGTDDEGAGNVPASSQDVSISAQPGRDSPIAVPMTAGTSTAVQDDTDPITIMKDEEAELQGTLPPVSLLDLSETGSLVSDLGYPLSSITETSPACSEVSIPTTRGDADTTASLATSSSKLSQDLFVNSILKVFRKVAPNSRYKPRRHRGKKSRVIPSELSMLWSHSTEIFQERQVSPPQAELTPRVNWAKVNRGAMKSFPKPSWQPVLSVSPSPSFYEKSCDCPATIIKHYRHGDVREPNVCSCPTQFTAPNPFGELPGFVTNLGVVPVPDSPIHGHIWDQASCDWILHAEFPTPGFASTLGSTSCPTLQQDRRQANFGSRGHGERRRGRRRPPERR